MTQARRTLGLLLLFAAIAAAALVVVQRPSPRDAQAPRPSLEPELAPADPIEPVWGFASADDEGDEAGPVEPAAPSASARTPAATAASVGEAASEATLIVRVTSSDTGRPLARIRVRASPTPRPRRWTSREIDGADARMRESPLTASDGLVTCTVAAGKRYRVAAWSADDTERQNSVVAEALAPGERREITLAIATGPEVRYMGRVVAEESGRPIAGARIRLFPNGFFRRSKTKGSGLCEEDLPPALATIASDEHGDFELSAYAGLRHQLRIDAPGRTLAIVALDDFRENEASRRIVRMRHAASVEVRVAGATGPRQDVVVRWSTRGSQLADDEPEGPRFDGDPAWRAATDVDGIASFEALPARVLLDLEIVFEGRVIQQERGALVLAPGERRHVERRTGSLVNVRGTLVDPLGGLLAGREVRLERAGPYPLPGSSFEGWFGGSSGSRRVSSDERGAFEFTDVPPGDWVVRAWEGGRELAVGEPAERLVCLPERVNVPVDGTVEIVVRFVTGQTIRGRVLDAEGRPAPRVDVSAQSTDGAEIVFAETDEHGSFALVPLLREKYDVGAHPSGKERVSSESVRASVCDEDVELRLRRAGSLACSFVDESGTPRAAKAEVVSAGGSLEGTRTLRAHGSHGEVESVAEGILPGLCSVFASTDDGLAGLTTGIEVRAGETSQARVVLRPGAILAVLGDCDQGAAWYRVESKGVCLFVELAVCGMRTVRWVPAGKLGVRRFTRFMPSDEVETVDLAPGERGEIVLNLR